MSTDGWIGMVIGVGFLAFILGTFAGGSAERTNLHESAIAHQAAHYDARTGAFTWDKEAMK